MDGLDGVAGFFKYLDCLARLGTEESAFNV